MTNEASRNWLGFARAAGKPARRHRGTGALAAVILAAVGAGLATATVFLGIVTAGYIDRTPGDFHSSPAALAHPVNPFASGALATLTVVIGLAACAVLVMAGRRDCPVHLRRRVIMTDSLSPPPPRPPGAPVRKASQKARAITALITGAGLITAVCS